MFHSSEGSPHPDAFKAFGPTRFSKVFSCVAGAISSDGEDVDAATTAASPDCAHFADPEEAMGEDVDMKAVAAWVKFKDSQSLEVHALPLLAFAESAEELRPAPRSFCHVQHFGKGEGPKVEMALPILGDGIARELERHLDFVGRIIVKQGGSAGAEEPGTIV